jgi:ABC-type sugar transport system ATPase subunit
MGSLAFFDRAGSIAEANKRMAGLGVHLDDYSRPVRDLSGGQRQCVAIARTIVAGVRVVILDEPTAALGVRQKSLVLRLARRLADEGAAVVMITHDVESVEASPTTSSCSTSAACPTTALPASSAPANRCT